MITLAVSRCLMGDNVRYDGKTKSHDFVINQLAGTFTVKGASGLINALFSTDSDYFFSIMLKIVELISTNGISEYSLSVSYAEYELRG